MKNHNLNIRTTAYAFIFISSVLFAEKATELYASGQSAKIQTKSAPAVNQKIKKENDPKIIQKGKEKSNEQLHESEDLLNKETVHNKIDHVFDQFDKESINEKVDQIADYFDKDKLKEAIDLIDNYLDRDKIKRIIEVFAEQIDREKIKSAVDTALDSFDKTQAGESFDQTANKIASSLDKGSDRLSPDTKNKKSDWQSIEKSLLDYDWEGLIPERAFYGPATLSHLKLNGNKRVAVVRPGEKITGEVVCNLNREDCSALKLYRVVLGFKDREGQTTVFNHFGLRAGKEKDQFVLTAPQQKGIYQLGFRVVEAALESTALDAWESSEGEDKTPTIGLIIVS